jgi:hypothetical protein
MYTPQHIRSSKNRKTVDDLRSSFAAEDAKLRSSLIDLYNLEEDKPTTISHAEAPDTITFNSSITPTITVRAHDKESADQVVDLVVSSLVQSLNGVPPDEIPKEMDKILATPSNVNYGTKKPIIAITERNMKKLKRFDLFDTAINKALTQLDEKHKSTTEKFTSYFGFIKDKIYTWLGLTLQGGYARGKTRRNKRNKQNKSKKGKQSNKRSKRRRRTSKRRRTHRK